MHQVAFIEYATRYLLIPGQLSLGREVIRSAGLPHLLPKTVDQLIQLNDELEHKSLVLTDSNPMLVQWNPFSGMGPIMTQYALGVGAFDDHRWLQSIHHAAVKVLYDQIHESVHAIWAAFGLCGGLNLVPLSQHGRFHTLAEATAVYMSDIEAHEALLKSNYFDDFWPNGATRSHAISFSSLKGLRGSGLSDSERADWLLSVYLDQERSLPHLPTNQGLKAEALAFLIEESSYAEKIDLYTTPQWLRYYWGRDELHTFLADFVPQEPIIDLQGQSLSSFDDLRAHWRAVLEGQFWFYHRDTKLIKIRLKIQRFALKLSELLSVFNSYRLLLSDDQITQGRALIMEIQSGTLELFQKHTPYSQLKSNSVLSDERLRQIKEKLEQLSSQLVSQLCQICGDYLIVSHPYLDALPFGDATPPLKYVDPEPRELSELMQCLKIISAEYKAAYLELKTIESQQSLSFLCKTRYLEAQQWLSELQLDQQEKIRLQAQQFLNQELVKRTLPLIYPLSWLTAAPFVDPLIGFRYQ